MSFATATLVSLVSLVAATSCAPRPRMCAATSECAAQSSCVAGRCQPERANVKPAIDTARRLVVHPADVAFVRRGDPPADELPPQFVLGRDPAILLLRFSVDLTPAANVVEAYLVLRRSDAVDDDPAPISLHATRIVERWSGRAASWALQPRTAEVRAPVTVAHPAGPALVRLDVRDLVRRWARHEPTDQGVAVTADSDGRTGMTFAFRASGVGRASPADPYLAAASGPLAAGGGDAPSSASPDVEPYLELYVR